ncbi:hypothetical protein KMC96_gp38 [Lactococcus phage CHPC122]|uniref:Uncharacterized protein n=1 Tax=Lactococcus phage CHPC122 TaxID=2675244 RepID=A0A650ET86_9CAUD|nr:hypothetical protein KMC96_gp38 [Lactococcus phage CHPC122]QGT52728.1 hypothetical protein CHPC122_000382 [Lactococcus phage CHPC122]
MTIFKAYCWNSNTGRDFTIKKPNWNIVQRCSLKSIETIQYLPQHIYLLDGTTGPETSKRWQRKKCPDDWNRPYSYGSIVTKPQGENKISGIAFCTDYERKQYPSLYPNFITPNLTQGQKYGLSGTLYNSGINVLEVSLKLLYGTKNELVGTYQVQPNQYLDVKEIYTLPSTETVEKFGIAFEVAQTSDFVQFEVYLPKIEQGGEVTPFVEDRDEFNGYRKTNTDDGTPPFTGTYEGTPPQSVDYKVYTWVGSKTDKELFYLEERGICKQEAVWCYSRPLGQRVLIGIDSDTYDTEAGRTLKFHVLNGDKGVFDLTGNVIYPEQFTDKRQTFDSDTKAWVDNQEPLYVTDANTAIDCTFGEMASNIIEGYYYQQADKRYRVDELLRSAMINTGYNMGSYWSSWDFNSYVSEMRASYNIENCRVSEKTSYSSMNEWTGSVAFPTGVVLAPYKPKLNETDSQKLKGVSSATSIWAKGNLRTERTVEDWFREYENSRTRPVPTQILFANYNTKKAWLFQQQSNGTWSKSGEFTIPGSDTALASAWGIIPKNGELKGNVIMTDKGYNDFPNNARPITLGVEELFPVIKYNEVKFNPQMYATAYNTKLFWWGQKANVSNLTYGECGVRSVDFMTGLCTIERVYK